MKCEQEYCICNKERECRLKKVSINEFGMCDECLLVMLDKDFLEMEKGQQLQEIERRWNEAGE